MINMRLLGTRTEEVEENIIYKCIVALLNPWESIRNEVVACYVQEIT